MKNWIKKAVVGAAVAVSFLGLTVTPADAANSWVHNSDCRHSHLTLYLRDSHNWRYIAPPGATRVMPNSGRQVWVPSNTYLFIGQCGSAADIDVRSGHWHSFPWYLRTDMSLMRR